MSVGGVGGGGGGGGASAASSAGRGGGGGGPSGASKGGGPSGASKGGPSGASKGGPSGASKGGPSGTSAKSTGSVSKGPSSSSTPTNASTNVDKGANAKNATSTSNTTSTERSATEQAKDAERQRAQNEIQSDKFQRNGAPTTSGDVVKNMMQSQGINAGTAASSAVVPGSNGSDAATAAPAASGAGATTSDAGLAETTAANDAADAQVKQETKETAGREAIRNAAGNGMDMVGNAYQAYGDGQGKAASREFKGKVATVGSRLVGDALQRTGEFGAKVGTAIRDAGAYVGDKLSGWADKAAAKWQSGKGIGSAVGGVALRGTGAVFSVGGDIIQSGMPKSFAEGGALVTKNIISGGAATVGAVLGGFVGGPPGAVGGAVLSGGAVDGVAGRIADSLWGTNRYDSGPSIPADVQFPNDWNVAP